MNAVIDLRPEHAPKALVSYEFNRDTNEVLKHAAGGRWDPKLKSWWVPHNQVTPAANALQKAGYEVQYIGAKLGTSIKPGNLENATYAFLAELEPQMRRKAFKALALSLHPDTGGDTDVMRQVNDAYQRAGTA